MSGSLSPNKESLGTWQDAMNNFLFWKRGQGIAPVTLEDYRRHVTWFFTRCPDAWDPDKLRSRILEYMAQDVMPTTFNLRRAYLKAFFAWCVSEGILPQNPLHGIRKRKDIGKIRHLDEDALQKLLKLPDRRTFAGLRDYALISLTLATGIRPGEALQLLPQDIDLKRRSITIQRQVAKTREERVLPIPPAVAEALRSLLLARASVWGEDTPVFCSYAGKPMTTSTWGHRLALYAKELNEKVPAYSLRHSFAIETLRAGANAFTVQHMLGHTTMNMTLRYVRLVEGDLREAMSRSNPLDRIMPQTHRVRNIDHTRNNKNRLRGR